MTPSVNALPLSAAAFTGRERELRALDALIPEGTAPLITVTGAGGIGKTALVLHWAQGISARYPDGLLYVDLEGFSNRSAAVADGGAVAVAAPARRRASPNPRPGSTRRRPVPHVDRRPSGY
nr:hypothetical protein GCM10020092_023040 [Actinoplanes digitatis]